MKILLTGGQGQLGLAFKKIAPVEINNRKIQIFDPIKKDLDISNEEDCLSCIKNIRPDWVINSAAFTNVEQAEVSPDKAYSINGDGPLFLSKAVNKYGGNLIQISTDFVFDGNKNSPYKVDDSRNPLCVYGKSKEKGELAVEEILHPKGNGMILRTSWLMSPSRSNFLLTIVNLLGKKEKINVVYDQIGCPTSSDTLAKVLWKLIHQNHKIDIPLTPYLHCCDDGKTNWFEVAKYINSISKEIGIIKKNVEIIPIKSSLYKTLAKRPQYSLLDNSLLKKKLDFKIDHWELTIKEILLKVLDNQKK